MNEKEKVDPKMNRARRNLVVATSVVGGAAGIGVAAPFVASMWPSERARAAGAPIEVDVSRIAPGELAVFEWRGKPVWVLRRTPEMIASLKAAAPRLSDPNSKASDQPKYAENEYRSARPDLLVLVGVCTHLGCSRRKNPQRRRARWVATGRAASIALAMARSSISPGAFGTVRRRRPTSSCRPIPSCPRAKW